MYDLLFLEPTKWNVEESVVFKEYIESLPAEEVKLLEFNLSRFIATRANFMTSGKSPLLQNSDEYTTAKQVAAAEMEKLKRFYFDAGKDYMRKNLEKYEGHANDPSCFCGTCVASL